MRLHSKWVTVLCKWVTVLCMISAPFCHTLESVPSEPPIVILGCGFTGRRVLQLMNSRPRQILATIREPRSFPSGALDLQILAMDLQEEASLARLTEACPRGAVVLHSIPTLRTPTGPLEITAKLLVALPDPSRVIYLSTTGVYGKQSMVDHRTLPDPALPRHHLRLQAEEAVRSGSWQSLILRPAGIYGPGRGVHRSMREGRYKLVEGGRLFQSRIHAGDLARIVAAALDSPITGAFPVADDHPCQAREIAAYCAELLGLPPPREIPLSEAPETLRSDRRVDGREIRRRLNLELLYPSYRQGIPASLAAEESVNR